MTMKTVRVAELKAKLSEYLRAVRKGHSVRVLDRETPVATLVPIEDEALAVRHATRRVRELPAPPRQVAKTDSVAILLADRQRR
jgi:prevent-host-death family protein